MHSFPATLPGSEYDAKADSELLVVIQIESQSGVENVEKISAVDGVDILLIGKLSREKLS